MAKKSAFITGGASGMGLAVAEALAARTHEAWDLHLVDLNAEAGAQAASAVKNAHFHQADVTSYESLTSAFENAFAISGRFDLVYANAGIVERDNFYQKHDLSRPPPPPNQLSIDINFKSVVSTAYLALHYFRKSSHGAAMAPALVMTASCGGLYPSEFCPMYSGAKAAVVHFNRTIAYPFHSENIRTYVTCPGTIQTNLLSSEEWESFPKQYFTPMDTLVKAVEVLVDGGDMTDSRGKKVAGEDAWGLTVEVNRGNFYFRENNAYCDEDMKAMMKFTSMEGQLARMEKTKSEQAKGIFMKL